MEQLRQFSNLSSWREENLSIKAGETYTHDFRDTTPNMFVLQNPNYANLLISISKIPTKNNYEFKAEPHATKTFGRPTGTGKLYILNTSDSDVTVKLFSIAERFDINILNDVNISVEGATIQTDGIIRGFESGSSLPTGYNTIGAVDMGDYAKAYFDDFLKSMIGEEEKSSTDLFNLITANGELSDTNAQSIITNQGTIIENQNTILANQSTIMENLTSLGNILYNAFGRFNVNEYENYYIGIKNKIINVSKANTVIFIEYLKNTGDSKLVLKQYYKNANENTYSSKEILTLEPNEIITDFYCYLKYAGEQLNICEDHSTTFDLKYIPYVRR